MSYFYYQTNDHNEFLTTDSYSAQINLSNSSIKFNCIVLEEVIDYYCKPAPPRQADFFSCSIYINKKQRNTHPLPHPHRVQIARSICYQVSKGKKK